MCDFSDGDIWESYNHLTPGKITELLRTKGSIVGEDDTVRSVALTTYHHIHGRASTALVVGPSGCGKTRIFSALQEEFGANRIVIHDASHLTAEGWAGSVKISTIFKAIPPESRSRVLLVLDEFDKLLEPKNLGGQGSYSDMMQSQVLRVFDHQNLFLGGVENEKSAYVDTSGVSIVLLGAFQRLLENKSADRNTIGFGNDSYRECTYDNSTISLEDLTSYGMREELAGRITRIICMKPLTIDDLILIGQNEVKNLERIMKCKIVIDKNVLSTMAVKAHNKKFGARQLKMSLCRMLDKLVYDNPNAEQYIINLDTCADEIIHAAACME